MACGSASLRPARWVAARGQKNDLLPRVDGLVCLGGQAAGPVPDAPRPASRGRREAARRKKSLVRRPRGRRA